MAIVNMYQQPNTWTSGTITTGNNIIWNGPVCPMCGSVHFSGQSCPHPFKWWVDEENPPEDTAPIHLPGAKVCDCGCDCEPNGEWHFLEEFCACKRLGCPCVSDAPGSPAPLESS